MLPPINLSAYKESECLKGKAYTTVVPNWFWRVSHAIFIYTYNINSKKALKCMHFFKLTLFYYNIPLNSPLVLKGPIISKDRVKATPRAEIKRVRKRDSVLHRKRNQFTNFQQQERGNSWITQRPFVTRDEKDATGNNLVVQNWVFVPSFFCKQKKAIRMYITSCHVLRINSGQLEARKFGGCVYTTFAEFREWK